MITELMIILTVVGAGIVIFVWTGSRRRSGENFEQQEVAESTAKFKQELENTANEIIGRMENQATHLENLLDDSERNRTQMEGRIAELKKLIKRSENQSGEVRELLSRLDGAVEDVDAMKRQIEYVERKISAVSNAKSAVVPPMQQQKVAAYQQPRPPVQPPVQQQASFARVLEQKVSAPAPVAQPSGQTAKRGAAILPRENPQPAKPADADTARIEAIRQNLIRNAAKMTAQAQTSAPKPPPQVRAPNIPNVNRQAEALIPRTQNPPPQPAPVKKADSLSIRDMLLAGMTIEEVARKTGLGRGAVELVQQMIRHQLEKR
ncbi:MAG: hypothetical protein J5809_01250 [Selenomonadaceae bacterium]|nr:hypothetical protein [Selenomonadaceae bacterium]